MKTKKQLEKKLIELENERIRIYGVLDFLDHGWEEYSYGHGEPSIEEKEEDLENYNYYKNKYDGVSKFVSTQINIYENKEEEIIKKIGKIEEEIKELKRVDNAKV